MLKVKNDYFNFYLIFTFVVGICSVKETSSTVTIMNGSAENMPKVVFKRLRQLACCQLKIADKNYNRFFSVKSIRITFKVKFFGFDMSSYVVIFN